MTGTSPIMTALGSYPSGSQLVHGLTDARELRDEPKRTFQPRMVRFGLIRPESRFGEDVDIDQLRAGAD